MVVSDWLIAVADRRCRRAHVTPPGELYRNWVASTSNEVRNASKPHWIDSSQYVDWQAERTQLHAHILAQTTSTLRWQGIACVRKAVFTFRTTSYDIARCRALLKRYWRRNWTWFNFCVNCRTMSYDVVTSCDTRTARQFACKICRTKSDDTGRCRPMSLSRPMSSDIVRQGIQRCRPMFCAVWTPLKLPTSRQQLAAQNEMSIIRTLLVKTQLLSQRFWQWHFPTKGVCASEHYYIFALDWF